MIPIFVEAALRSILAGLAVGVGLRIFRIGNVLAQKAAWGLVLVSALAMPLLLPVTARWHLLPARVNVSLPARAMTFLEKWEDRVKPSAVSFARSQPAGRIEAAKPEAAAPAADGDASRDASTGRTAKSQSFQGRAGASSAQLVAYRSSSVNGAPVPAPARDVQRVPVSPVTMALALYGGVSGILLARLLIGFLTTVRLWSAASVIPADQMPSDAASLRLRASSGVASPVTIGWGILLPADYAEWEEEKLRIVLAHERSHVRQGDFYLQLLASIYAALVWFSPLGWWLKHELAELAEAISDRAGMEEAISRAAYAQILLEFAAAPRRIPIGVAMARPGSLSRRIERLLNDQTFRQCFAGGRRALVGVALVPLALLGSTTLLHVRAAAATQAASSLPIAAPALTANQHSGPAAALPQPAATTDLEVAPEAQIADSAASPETAAAGSPEPATGAEPSVAAGKEGVQEKGPLSFDRTLSVGAAAQLTVTTGSGNIHIKRGSGNQIRVHGQVHVNREGSEDEARQIAANPPIEQSGDMVRVGQQHEQRRGISIDYEIEAPGGTLLVANSGSGDVVDEGVGQNAKLETGSGDIRATGLQGPFTVRTGSGNIVAEQTGEGDVAAETGSGEIELKNIHGGFHGQTGSGDIKATGTPSSSWVLQTGSGNIELWTGNAPLTLDASTASGSVTTEHEMVVKGSFNNHHIQGTLHGGGPMIRAQTGSGDIQVH